MIAEIDRAFQVYGLAGGIIVSFVSGFWLLVKFLMRVQSRMMEQHEQERANWNRETAKLLEKCCETLKLVSQLQVEHHQLTIQLSRSLDAHIKDSAAKNATLLERTGRKGNVKEENPQ